MGLFQRCAGPKGNGHLMCITSLVIALSCSCALLSGTALGEVTGVGPPLALAPGESPPLPKQGPLAEPRSSDQVGFLEVLTEYAISPATLTPARVALAQKLFFEARLSGDGTVACATCHNPDRAFTDGRSVSVGIHGRAGQRNAPTVLNALYNKHQFWDGRVRTLEQQAALPITNPFEMGSASIGDAVSMIANDKEYQAKLDATLFIDNDFHNIGIGILRHHVAPLAQQVERELAQGHLAAIDAAAITSETSVVGRFLVTRKKSDIASFKTPGLRNVVVTAPYFHDASMQTLWDVMDHYNKGDGITDPWLDKDVEPLALSEPEIDDVVAFLASLTSPQYKVIGDREYAQQLALAKVSRPQRDTARAFGPKPKQPQPPPL
jgi:cytochrome c peroxidase